MYYFIVNPQSKSGRGIKVWHTVEALLRKEHIPHRPFFTQDAESTVKLVRRLCMQNHPTTIVAVGGDGTVNDVVNGLTDFSHITFGYIPTGSGNDFARGLKLESDPVKALYRILHPSQICALSVGSLATAGFSRRFLVSSGMGFDAAVCVGTLRSKIKVILNRIGLGKLTYTGIALKQIAMAPCPQITLTLDDGDPVTYPGIFFAAAMNLPYEGGGFMFCPNAQGEDDFLDLILVEKINKLKIVFMLPTAFFGRHTRIHGVHIHTFRKAVLTSDQPLFLHTDGEVPGKSDSITWSLLSEKLPFILR